MKDAYYFSHDYHARSDENIIRLLQKEKVQGYGIYWILVEMLYESGGSIQKDYEILAYEMRTQCECIKAVCEDFGLFYFKENRIYSKSVDRRLAEIENKKFKAREIAMRRWGNNAKAMPRQCQGNAVKESKVKESKGKERKDTSIVAFQPPNIDQVTLYCIERRNNISPNKWLDFYQSKNWMIGKNKMKDWKAAVRTWEHSDFNTKPIQAERIHKEWEPEDEGAAERKRLAIQAQEKIKNGK